MSDIPARRLHNQQLEHTQLRSPEEVVAWLGAVQAQEYAHAKWALALRLHGVKDSDVEQIFNDGAILRTHVMRPTWHFVLPSDIRWMLSLTAPRVNALLAGQYRQYELNEDVLGRSMTAIGEALLGAKFLTRSELGSALAAAGIQASGQRLGFIIHRAEIEAVICSGPRRGKQFTYALLSERAQNARTLPRDEALALLVRRYFTSHGPAQVHDFVWWSGLTVADTRAGLEMNKAQLVAETIGGKTYWQAASAPTAVDAAPGAIFLPPYDEYTSYGDRSTIVDPTHAFPRPTPDFFGTIAVRGMIVGTWRRTILKGSALIETRPFRPFTTAERDALAEAAQHYGEFLGMAVELRV
jgi:hypothetical protein